MKIKYSLNFIKRDVIKTENKTPKISVDKK
jgi:hypothetical protein